MSRSLDRQPHLRIWAADRPGYIVMGVCTKCRRVAPFPIDALIKRFGEIYPVEQALMKLHCAGCQTWGRDIEPRWFRLCDLGCPRQRG